MLNIRLMGSFALRRDDGELPPLRTRKEAWLVALLLLRHPQPVERDTLAATLWPDSDPAQARYNLRRSLSNLRAVLGTDARFLTAPTPHSLSFDLSDVAVDMLQFDAAIKDGLKHEDTSSLRAAVENYGGAFLEGCEEAWANTARTKREQELLQALETLADDALGRKQFGEAAEMLRRVLHIDPLRESAVQRLLRASAGMGDVPAALVTYRDFRHRLALELRAEPDSETRRLYQAIKKGNVPEVGTEARIAAPRALEKKTPALSRLPYPLTELVGRQAEVEAIRRDLRKARLVTLTGTGGLGKTRLAVAVGALVVAAVGGQGAEDFAESVGFVDLTPLESADAAAVARIVAQTLELPDPTRESLPALQQALRDQDLLLILDNCEHLIDACRDVVQSLLGACPRLHVLATSRQSLGIMGEKVRRIPPLSLPPQALQTPPLPQTPFSAEAVAQVEAAESVRLFVERAHGVNADFHLTAQNAPFVAEICHRLEGVPFALELAASWAKALDVAQIAARLQNPLSLTGSEPVSVPGKSHRGTLRATLAWSYSLLTPREQELLRHLSVFVGGWTLEAAEQGGGEVLEPLTRLVDKSLVAYAPDKGGDSAGRYRLLESTRQFALEAMGEAERESITERHASYFRQQVEGWRERDYRRIHTGDGKRWLIAERANCLAALARTQKSDPGAALPFRLTLLQLGVLSYHSPESRAWIVALQNDPHPPQTPFYAELYCDLGRCALWIGENEAGRDLMTYAVGIAQACGDTRNLARAACSLGIQEMEQEQFPEARQHLEQALACYEQIAEPFQAAICRDYLSETLYEQGDRSQAQRLVDINQQIGEAAQDERILAEVYWRRSWLAWRENDRAAALRALEHFIHCVRRSQVQPIDIALERAGHLCCDVGEPTIAWVYLEESLAASRERDYKPGEGWALDGMALAALAQANVEQATEYARRSLRIFHDLGERGSTSGLLARLGEIYASRGDWQHEVTLLAQIEAMVQKRPLMHTSQTVRELRTRALRGKERLAPESFDRAWRLGGNMTLEQAVSFALNPASVTE